MKKVLIGLLLIIIQFPLLAPTVSFFVTYEFNHKAIVHLNEERYNKELTRFIDHLGYKESNNNWMAINDIGCLGEWQFSYPTLEILGYGHITPDKFKSDPSIFPRDLQLTVLRDFIKTNANSVSLYKEYFNTYVNDVYITKAGLLAAAHLGGIGSIDVFITSNGTIDRTDLYGTKVSDYIKEFSLYDL